MIVKEKQEKIEEGAPGETKLCPGCGKVKDVDLDFGYRSFKGRIYKQSHCRQCRGKKKPKAEPVLVGKMKERYDALVENVTNYQPETADSVPVAEQLTNLDRKVIDEFLSKPDAEIVDEITDTVPVRKPVVPAQLIIEIAPKPKRSRKKADLVVDVNVKVETDDRLCKVCKRVSVNSASNELPEIGKVCQRCWVDLSRGIRISSRDELTALYRGHFPGDKGHRSDKFTRPVKFMANKLIAKFERQSINAALVNEIKNFVKKECG